MFTKEFDTICAISTGMSTGGIGIVRLSGSAAFSIIDEIYMGKDAPLSNKEGYTIHYGHIYDNKDISDDCDSTDILDNCNHKRILDEVLVSVFRAPKSYTGEDVIEINCHGGSFVLREVLNLLVKKGARLAEPGEFTKRAFLNGRIDLSQAQSVMDLISSHNEASLQNSNRQLSGELKELISSFREQILHETAYIESALDDPEHYDLDDYSDVLSGKLISLKKELSKLSSSFSQGLMIREGILTAIVGKPNVGKSSFLNFLAGEDRAIVTDIPGTTRDVLEEQVRLGDYILRLVDTAGIRNTEDQVEKIGVSRSLEWLNSAQLVIFLADSSRPLDQEDEDILKELSGKEVIYLYHKADQSAAFSVEEFHEKIRECNFSNENLQKQLPSIVEFSSKTGEGKDAFLKAVEDFIGRSGGFTEDLSGQLFLSKDYQKQFVDEAILSIEKVLNSIQEGLPEDFYTIDLMGAYESLGNITGETLEDDLADKIFRDFCMGK